MNRYVLVLICLLGTIPARPAAADQFCEFSTDPEGAVTNARYDIGKAYQASDAVVVGRLTGGRAKGRQPLQVKLVVKAPNAGALTYEGQPASERPVFEGVRLPTDRDFLMFLRTRPGGGYATVDGQPNVCPTIFPVKDGFVSIGSQAVALEKVEKFLESRPDAIAYP